MFLVLEIIFIVLLSMILFMLHQNEKTFRHNSRSRAEMEEYWNGSERREHVRFASAVPVSYAISKSKNLEANGKTVDISAGGAKLLLAEKLPEGAMLDLQLNVPNAEGKIMTQGEVVWSEEARKVGDTPMRLFHVGVRFSKIKEPHAGILLDYLKGLAAGAKKFDGLAGTPSPSAL